MADTPAIPATQPGNETSLPKIPDHDLVRCLGAGAFGEVWLAKNRALGKYRAVKIVRIRNKNLFEREFKGLQRYEPVSRTHPSLLSVLHVGKNDDKADGYLYYIMDLADDRDASREFDPHRYEPKTLAGELNLRKRLPLQECVAIARELTSALRHLHNHDLLHRDIKPANIVFHQGHPKLADFGLVAADDPQSIGGGTFGYVPPEGHRGPQGDIYSLGKVLYVMSTGKDACDFPEPPTDLETSPDQATWRALNRVILRACADKDSRYRSAADLQVALMDMEKPPTPPPVVWRWALILSVLAVVGAIAAISTVDWRRGMGSPQKLGLPGRTVSRSEPPSNPPSLNNADRTEPDSLRLDLGGGIPLDLVRIPAGQFLMGADEGSTQEQPVHRVKLAKDFWLGRHEVTQEQFESVMGHNPSRFKGSKLPVNDVSWEVATAFVNRVNEMGIVPSGLVASLPTEAEWEYACRAGTTTAYPTGDDRRGLVEGVWNDGEFNGPHPVGQKKANAFGLFDMIGNVGEWCQDWYAADFYAQSPSVDPSGPETGQQRVLRGGSFFNQLGDMTSAGRDASAANQAGADRGFRLCLRAQR